MAFLPLAGLSRESAEDMAEEIASAVQPAENGEEGSEGGNETEDNDSKAQDSFVILDTGSGEKLTVDDKSFCIGALACEMPPVYHEEALKAQCIACYTHFCRLREMQRSDPDPELGGAYFKADLSKGREYLREELLREKWGDRYEEYRSKLAGVVDAVFGLIIKDREGKAADVAYYAISSGVTEDSEDIFGFESDYLKAVPSPWDLNAPGYCSEKKVDRGEFNELLKKEDGSYSAEKGIGDIKRTASGSVLSIVIGGVEYKGARIRELFGLRSAVFTINEADDSVIITVKGYGHGAGMSQYGANAMAEQGADYKEIIYHYYRANL